MKSPSSNGAIEKQDYRQRLKPLMIISGFACLLILFLLAKTARQDPYIMQTTNLTGSIDNGEKLFKMNCVGCHGISAQGLVGPDLNS